MSVLRLLMFVAWMGWMAGAGAQPAEASRRGPGAAPAIESFDVEQVERLDAGVPLRFGVYGSARGAVTLYIEGSRRLLDLTETQPGIYEGTYVIDANDAIRPESRVIATLQRQGQVVRSTLDEPLVLERSALPWAATDARGSSVPPPPAPAAPARAPCGDCAVVESIRSVESPPRRGPLGAVGGAIVGALFGDKVAEEHLRRMRRALGPLGDPLVGRETDGQGNGSTQYDVVLRLPDGSTLLRRYDRSPGFQPGDTVSLSGSGTRSAQPAIY